MHWYDEHMARTEPDPECGIKERTIEDLLDGADSPHEHSLVLEIKRLRRLLVEKDELLLKLTQKNWALFHSHPNPPTTAE
jgi:hypothetical protein